MALVVEIISKWDLIKIKWQLMIYALACAYAIISINMYLYIYILNSNSFKFVINHHVLSASIISWTKYLFIIYVLPFINISYQECNWNYGYWWFLENSLNILYLDVVSLLWIYVIRVKQNTIVVSNVGVMIFVPLKIVRNMPTICIGFRGA